MQKSSGFTVVEIIVVCIAIGILASVVVVGWAGTLTAGKDRNRASEQKEWATRFETYRNRFMVYPNSADDTGTTSLNSRYCLGTNFPSNNCAGGGILTSTNDSSPNKLMQALAKVGSLPSYTHEAINGYTGPWADYTNSTRIRIYHSYLKSTCPDGTTKDTSFTGATICYIEFTKN